MRNPSCKEDSPSLGKWGIKNPRDALDCMRCGAGLPLYRHYLTYLCDACLDLEPNRNACVDAGRIVNLAVKLGYLPRISSCVCVDCGAPARAYDHRDYNKPLDVEPVCSRCNHRRGPAIPRRREVKP